MSPKWAKKAHFGDIFYNVFNMRKILIFDDRNPSFHYILADGPLE